MFDAHSTQWDRKCFIKGSLLRSRLLMQRLWSLTKGPAAHYFPCAGATYQVLMHKWGEGAANLGAPFDVIVACGVLCLSVLRQSSACIWSGAGFSFKCGA